MTDKARVTITARVDPALSERLNKMVKREHRTINGTIILMLEKQLGEYERGVGRRKVADEVAVSAERGGG